MTYNVNQQTYSNSFGTTPTLGIHFDTRSPNQNDVNYPVGKFWQNTPGQELWYLNGFTITNSIVEAVWILIASNVAALEKLEADTGGPISPNASNSIFINGDGATISTIGNPGTNSITITALESLATSYVTNSGTAIPTSNVLNVLGSSGITTTGSGNTLIIASSGEFATQYTTDDASHATPSGGNLNIFGSGGILTSSSGSTVTISGASLFSSIKNQVFTVSGTYTPTSGMKYCSIQCKGGGGAGGGGPTTTSTQCAAGGGGGAGEYASGIFSAATIGASQAITVGAGGLGATNSAGGNGGNTSVGALISSHGGTGGSVGVAENLCIVTDGGAGGTGGAGGDYRTPGVPGGWGVVTLVSTGYISAGGIGGSGPLGSGGSVQVGAGLPGSGYGAGGGGCSNIPSTAVATAGGNGSAGVVVITEYIG